MNSTFSYRKIELLPDHLKNEVNDFIEFLLSKEKRKIKKSNKTEFLEFVGTISNEEAKVWKENIEEGCGKIDKDEW